jgi:Dolichyl-phosphate-mannose-protein mannosyltransferase
MKARRDLVLISCAYLLAHLLTTLSGAYGFFRDELYYIACTNHLSWGYVDQPPLSILLLAMNRALFGDSLFATRLLPAISGAAFVFVTGRIAAELGGSRFAQALAAVSAAIAPVYLAIFDFYSMNSFDLLFCALTFYVSLRIINSGNEKLWIILWIVVGLGLENKLGILFLCIGIGIGLLFSNHRRHFLSKWFWLGAIIAVAINIPHLVWQIQHHWPTLEFMRNATALKNARISPIEFSLNVIQLMHPFNALVWITGLIGLLFSPVLKTYRFLFISFVAVTLVFLLQNGKPYYLAPFFPVLFAAGGVVIEQFTSLRFKIVRPVLIILLVVGGLIAAPFTLPFLPVESYIRYAKFLGIEPESEERDTPGKLSQHYADMFGWKEMAQTVASVYARLSAEEKAKCGIYAGNYGEAAAIDFFGKKYGLPQAVSGHNSYWIWGPGKTTGEVMIIIGGELEEHQPFYEQCGQEATIRNEYARSFETNLPVFVCRHLKKPVAEVWPQTREFI